MKKDIKTFLSGNKTVFVLILLALSGILLLVFGNDGKKNTQTSVNDAYAAAAENKIEQTVKALCGGDAYVIVTLERGSETVYAKNTSGQSEQYLTASGGTPVTLLVIEPRIQGIAIVCDKGDDPVLKMRIIEAVSCAYGISSARIYVAPFN